MQYLRARYYDSSQGRFTTKDTLLGSTEKPITRNLYTYCGNNPLNITDPSGHGWFKNAWNSVKKTATKAVNTVKNIANKYVVQPIKSFISDPKGTAKKVCQNIKTQSKNLRTQATQKWNSFKAETSNRIQSAYNKYVPPKMQKAIEEAKKFVCTTTDRIVKTTTEFIQNVDWKKVAIGVAGTLAVAAVVVATGGAAAPVLIGAAVSAGVSTGITVVSGAVRGDSIEDIAKDASNSFMWGAISGAFGGGTTSLIKSAGKSAADNFVRNNLIEGGVDTVIDLAQTGYTNGEITGKDIALSAITNIGGAFIGSSIADAKTGSNPLTSSNNKKSISQSVEDSVSDGKTYQTYIKKNDVTGEVYSGRTSGYGSPAENVRNRDRNHHMNNKGFGPAELESSSNSYEAIRGREQDLIDYYGGAKSTGGTSGNAINGISDKNPKKDLYISSSRDEFGVLK